MMGRNKNKMNYKKFERIVRKYWRNPDRLFIDNLYGEFTQLKGRHNVVLGYGSLLNSKSAAKSLHGAKDLGFDYLEDYKRVFNMGFKDKGFLNIEHSPGTKIVVRKWQLTSHKQLAEYIAREANYNFIRKTNGELFCISDGWSTQIKPDRGYYNLCLAELGGEYRQNFFETTYNADGELTLEYFNT